MTGLYSIEDLACYLGVNRAGVAVLMHEAKPPLPFLKVPGKTREKVAFAPRPLCNWLNGRLQNAKAADLWTVETLVMDMERVLGQGAGRRGQGADIGAVRSAPCAVPGAADVGAVRSAPCAMPGGAVGA